MNICLWERLCDHTEQQICRIFTFGSLKIKKIRLTPTKLVSRIDKA